MNTTETTTERKFEDQRFEFVLTINDGKIVCQRLFNVFDYNEEVINSLDLKELSDIISGVNIDDLGSMGIIPNFLKKKSIDYLWNNFNPYYVPSEDVTVKPMVEKADKIDYFQFEIKVDKRTVIKSQFSGNLFPPKVRYQVDIREVIPSIMAEIRRFFAQKNYEKVEMYPAN